MMEATSPFNFNIKDFIIDEISLQGLEGIGLDSLWTRLEARTSTQFSVKLQEKCWKFIVNCENISIYKLPVPVQRIQIVDRFSIVSSETGYILETDYYLDGEFEYNLVATENGSCKHYKERKCLAAELKNMPYKAVLEKYRDNMVMVASKEERWKALAPHLPLSYMALVPPVSYCVLELIGRARENGQMTSGKTNLTKMIKDSKILFYYRKSLQNLGIIRVSYITQVSGGKTVKGLLLRLKRFYKPIVQTIPKTGILRNIVDYLMEQPSYGDTAENVIKQKLMTSMQYKKFQKKVNMFQFEDKLLPLGQSTNPKVKPRLHRKRIMSIIANSDESSQSEDEGGTPLKCQYKVGVNLMRQAYERFLEAGKNGLTQLEVCELLGVEFYVGRRICRVFVKKNIVREFIEYKGKQRMGRYIAIAATSKMENTLAEEQERFQKYLDEGKNTSLKRKASSDSEPLSQKKQRKLEVDKDGFNEREWENITEMNEILADAKKYKPKQSLRHMKFASGIIKILNEKIYIVGFQTLSNLVAKEINEPPMDTKAMKGFLHNMVAEGHIKVYKIKISQTDQTSIIICAPHVQINDPILKMKYKEIEHRTRVNKELKQKKLSGERSMSLYAYPRYVKVQKLHESLMKILYFSEVKSESTELPQGFFTIHGLIPDMPLGVALGHISSEGVIDIARFTIDNSLLDKKVSEGPKDLQRVLMKSSNLNASLRTSLKILSTYGLIQYIVESSTASRIQDNNMKINLFYLNRRAKIIDTSGNWPRNNMSDCEEKEYHFKCFADVQAFWSAVYNVSINTTIDIPDRKKATYSRIKTPNRTKEQVTQFDDGTRLGDNCGPCGYDSCYYMELQRLWSAYCVRSKTMQVKKIKMVKLPKLEKVENPKKQKNFKKNPQKIVVKKPPPPVVPENIKAVPKFRKRVREVAWSSEEDTLLMLCKAALLVVSPVSQPCCLQIRNLVAKDILTIKDPRKNVKACHRRAGFIDTKSTLAYEKDWLLNEFRRHKDLVGRYEGLLKKLRTMYPANMNKCINEARVPTMEVVWIMYHLLGKMAQQLDIPCVTMDYGDFMDKFNVTPASANRCLNFYRTPHSEIVLSTLKEAIILTVMLSFNNEVKKSSAELIYAYFKQFPETVLRSAVEPLRKCGAIAAKEKIMNSYMHIMELDDIAHCSYRISANYQRKWANRFSGEFGDSLVECLNQNETKEAIKAGGDTNCFCFELLSLGWLELNPITVPVITGPSGSIIQDEQLTVIDIENNFKLKSGKLSWKNRTPCPTIGKKYEDIPIDDALDYISRRSIIYNNDIPKGSHNDDIVGYLIRKGENGATFDELQETLKYDKATLIENIAILESENNIRRVGFYENVVVHIQYANSWSMKIKNGYIIPTPWMTLRSKLRREIFFQWAGVIMNKVFESPGCSIAYLSETCEFLTARAAQDICDVLKRCDCVIIQCLKLKEQSLFSDEDDVLSEMTEYNEYESPKNILIFPVQDCLNKFSYIRKIILDSS